MLKRALHLALATILGASLGVTQFNTASADEGTNDNVVYTQPGDHLVNGRYWRTECEMYSTTVVRCSTDIWATSIVNYKGRYIAHNGWVFNNLTYLPSNRADWGDNPLATTGEWTAADGRKWRTECDTANTGRGGCRSWAWANTIVVDGKTYTTKNSWIVNNIVQFATDQVAPVTEVPAAAPALAGVPVEGPIVDPRDEQIQKVITAARSKLGSRYVWGTSGPNTFDCSGFTSWAYRQIGVNLSRSSKAQPSQGRKVSKSSLQPGDLVFYYSPISHVALYLGNGQIIDAANPRTGVRIAKLDSMPYATAVRVI